MKVLGKISAFLAAAVLASTLTACSNTAASTSSVSSSASASAESSQVVVTTQVQAQGTPWVDANVIDVVTADTKADVHDDFYVATTKDWLIRAKIPSYSTSTSSFEETGWAMNDQLLALVEDTKVTDHDVELMRNYYELLMDWDVREKAGIDPIMPKLETVQGIQTIDELTAYLTSDAVRQQGNYLASYEGEPTGETLLSLYPNKIEKESGYEVSLFVNSRFTKDLSGMDNAGNTAAVVNTPFVQKATYMLGRAGFSSGEAVALVSLIAPLEERLAAPTEMTEAEEESFWSTAFELAGTDDPDKISDEQWDEILAAAGDAVSHTKEMTRDEMQQTAGNFPILALLDAYGFGDASRYIVTEPGWLAEMGKVYNQDNLEALKAHIICGILLDNMNLLDSAAVKADQDASSLEATMDEALTELQGGSAEGEGSETAGESEEAGEGEEASDDDTVPEARIVQMSDDEMKKINAIQAIGEDMPAVVTNAYLAHCYSEKAQARAEEMTKQIVGKYDDLINSEDWLDAETKKKAIEKLNAIDICVGYEKGSLPDTSGLEVLSIDEGGTLVDVSLALKAYNVDLTQEQLRNPNADMTWQDALTVNAYYSPTDNSIHICGGIIGGELFSEDWPVETQLAVLGCTIGHEISHAFDDNGAQYDKDGNLSNWWTAGDLADFEARTARVVNYLQTIDPIGQGAYNGSLACGETIADMGGLKVVLLVAADIDGFDYEKFFKDYSIGWRAIGTYYNALEQFYGDEHPLDATRMNASVMQVQEFYDTFDIKPGDTMYLAPEDRVSVW